MSTRSLELIDNLLSSLEAKEEKSNVSVSSLFGSNFVKPYPGHPQLILGSMEHGRRLNENDSIEVTKEFLKRDYTMIDTAYIYSDGKSETFLGKMQSDILIPNNALIATKANPNVENGLSEKGIIDQMNTSLKRLQTSKVDLYYLHMPDHKIDILESLKTMNKLYKEGKFKRFGLSNYSAWQVSEIYYLCKKHNFVLPTVYQGMYNVLTRQVESELFPCLRKFNIVFYAFNGIAGGLLSGKYNYSDLTNNSIKHGRFTIGKNSGQLYKNRYWHKSYFDAIEHIKKVLNKCYPNNSLSLIDASWKWLTLHSQLGKNDAIILGVGSTKHFKQNLDALHDKQPLKQELLDAFDEGWKMCVKNCPLYFR